MMDVERSSLSNCVVNFLLEENYLLMTFELLHELLDDGRDSQAIRLKEFFSDSSHFHPDQISCYNSLRVLDPQSLLEEKEAIEEKLALSDYELRLAQEDIEKLKTELQRREDLTRDKLSESSVSSTVNHAPEIHRQKRAGYRLTAMTFYEEVTDQNLDVWENSPASVPDALRHCYYQYMSSTSEAAEEKISMIREIDSLKKVNESLNHEKERLMKNKEVAEGQINALTKSLEATQKDLKDNKNLTQDLKHALELQRKELNDCRAESTSLKMQIEGSSFLQNQVAANFDSTQSQSLESYKEEIKSLQMEVERLKAEKTNISDLVDSCSGEKESIQTEEKVVEMDENRTLISDHTEPTEVVDSNALLMPIQTFDSSVHKSEENLPEPLMNPFNSTDGFPDGRITSQQDEKPPSEDGALHLNSENLGGGSVCNTLNPIKARGKGENSPEFSSPFFFFFTWKLRAKDSARKAIPEHLASKIDQGKDKRLELTSEAKVSAY
ncbi:histone-lysine N-methyltransferase, H3 lysine-9 specific SUVH1-like [Hibiscus syriacus]|uniref:Histone-lysine N-methyltransferase, H3 lysine-9 specific SUVH1-like n=1 Tax=Hibiscus syriacus TaxID=106335 RepID=A0A6A3AKR6_HIBSY|nr:histone-lysine N-methyltransferase, H3 lysine-9 specific SUVH1-like [Hibiscus syriacus]